MTLHVFFSMNGDKDLLAAASLQRLSRGFLARRAYERQQAERRSADERSGVKAPFVPTPASAIQAIQDHFVRQGDVMCDLGCGDGRVLIACAHKLDCGLGVDIQALPLNKAKEASTKWNDRLTWLLDDFYSIKVAEFLRDKATICFLFLLPEVISTLTKYLVTNMREGSRIVCYTFPIPSLIGDNGSPFEWKPIKRLDIPDLPAGACTIYEYIVDVEVKKKFA